MLGRSAIGSKLSQFLLLASLMIATVVAGCSEPLTRHKVPPARVPESESQVSSEIPVALVETIRSKLPQEWHVTAEGERVTIGRTRPVTVYNAINLPPLESKEALRAYVQKDARTVPYRLTLRFGPLLSPREYERLKVQNDRTLSNWHDKDLKRFLREHPELPYHKLPDWRSAEASVYLEECTARTHGWFSFLEDTEAVECDGVFDAVSTLFQEY